MLKLLADQNFNEDILRGLLLRNPELDIVRVRDVGLSEVDDPTILEWASQKNRILLTHDVNTVPKFAYERLAAGQPMSGVIEVSFAVSVGQVIEDILLIVECSSEDEWKGRVEYLPL
jgi:predicted nuclease of predicted toxin-antitoxin system